MKKSCSDFGRDSGRVPSSLVKYFCNIGRRNSFDKFMSFQRCEINRRCDSMALWHSVIDTNNLNYLLNPTPISVLNLKFMKRTTSKLYVRASKCFFVVFFDAKFYFMVKIVSHVQSFMSSSGKCFNVYDVAWRYVWLLIPQVNWKTSTSTLLTAFASVLRNKRISVLELNFRYPRFHSLKNSVLSTT